MTSSRDNGLDVAVPVAKATVVSPAPKSVYVALAWLNVYVFTCAERNAGNANNIPSKIKESNFFIEMFLGLS